MLRVVMNFKRLLVINLVHSSS